VTEQGKPLTAAGFGNWFRDRCDEAELFELSAHGVRKAAATRAAESGATAHQPMAMFGWLTLKQAEHYTRLAERARLAQGAWTPWPGGNGTLTDVYHLEPA
jgi:site-specific recombinase XerD